MHVLLIGHRGAGKSTAAAHSDLPHIDLDLVIERAHGHSCAQIIARHGLPAFRAIEADTLEHLLSTPHKGPCLVVLGAGFENIPQGFPTLWLLRDGWEDAAQHERARLRPELPWAQELAWMRATRTPRYARAAHLRISTPRGRSPRHVAQEIDTWVRWLHQAPGHPWLAKTYGVPTDLDELTRAQADHTWLCHAGVELRSDFFPTPPDLTTPCLASLRHGDPSWLTHLPSAAALDIDIAHLPATLQARTLDTLGAPRPLLLSCHPDTHEGAHIHALEEAAIAVRAQHPSWSQYVSLKYAPKISNWSQLEDAMTRTRALPGTFLPQGEAWAWTRPWLMARGNQTNYLPARSRHAAPDRPTPYDLQDWLPHMTSPAPEHFDALLGDPVQQSCGDRWHRRAALSESPDRSYLKIPIQGPLAHPVRILHDMGITNLSVTSPHKRALLTLGLHNPKDLTAANTATRDSLTDTDADGMRATLAHLESLGIGPGSLAVIGRGGVSPAVLRGIQGSGWTLSLHASARQGWPPTPPEVCAVINAAGDHDGAYLHAPAHRAWVDLHYQGVRSPPNPDAVHLNGDIFFDAQAHAQRVFWGFTPT